jgi:hypothetical protein
MEAQRSCQHRGVVRGIGEPTAAASSGVGKAEGRLTGAVVSRTAAASSGVVRAAQGRVQTNRGGLVCWQVVARAQANSTMGQRRGHHCRRMWGQPAAACAYPSVGLGSRQGQQIGAAGSRVARCTAVAMQPGIQMYWVHSRGHASGMIVLGASVGVFAVRQKECAGNTAVVRQR